MSEANPLDRLVIELAPGITIIRGDCRDVLPTLIGIDAVITDPPYGMNLNTDNSRFSGGNTASVLKRGRRGKGTANGAPILHDDEPFDPSPWLNFDKVVLWGVNHFGQRVPAGTQLVWIKRFDKAFGSFLSDAEIAWMKGGHGVYCKRDLTLNGEALTRVHPTQKPVPLMAWCMEKAKVPEGATVLDPFCGSGSTGVACIQTGRKFIGIEKDPTYFDIARRRLEYELAQGRLELAG